MANGFDAAKRAPAEVASGRRAEAKLGSRRIFAPQFKLQVLDSYRTDAECKGNQRATARKYGIHRRQIQKWLQGEAALRGAVRARGTSAVPLDCTTPKKEVVEAPQVATGPVDLSLKRAASPEVSDGAWDLSSKRVKFGYECEAPTPPQPAAVHKPFRLFRPYLMEDNFLEEQQPPQPSYDACNERCEAPSVINRYDSPLFHCFESSAFEKVVPRCVEDRSPVSSPVCSPYSCNEEDLPGSPKRRQSYSVDFKLQAINSYRQDAECRGNQRAVASKFRVHRRQVQKWLQQEDQLWQRTAVGPACLLIV